MSSSIWTRCAGDSEIRGLSALAWRVVEAQHLVSTRKLVDSAAEQELLEELIDGAKPPDITKGRVHYLLFTPFRYPPLRHGSRFGTRFERGIWYGSLACRTALAEVAYYRLLFLEGTTADLGALATPLTAFTVKLRTSRGVDLTLPPFASHRRAIASRTRYDASQALGAAMRAATVELCRYPSARDVDGGVNVAALDPAAFARNKPQNFETWRSVASRDRVEFTKDDYFTRESLQFAREQFLVGGALPAPAP